MLERGGEEREERRGEGRWVGRLLCGGVGGEVDVELGGSSWVGG